MSSKKTKFKETEIGKIPEDWEISTVGEVSQINAHSIGKTFQPNEIEYIDIDSVENGKIAPPKKMKLAEAPSRAKRIVRQNDILISTVRPNLKHFAFVKNFKPNTIASTGFAVITAKSVEPEFLYYQLTTDTYTNYLSAIADSHTSTYPSFNPDIIEKSNVLVPKIEEQRAIAKILSDLDAKIELNRSMNQTLESIAEALFKRWFVDFEFPAENGKPYKSSGGKMVESELGQIPEGWEVKNLSDIAEIKIGRTPPRNQKEWFSTNSEDVPWISIKDMGQAQTFINNTSEYLTHEAVERFNIPIIPKHTVVLSFKLTVGRVAITTEESLSNEAIAQFRIADTSVLLPYLYYYLTQYDYTTIGSTSSIATATNSEGIKKIRILIASKQLMTDYSAIIKPTLNTIEQNMNEIKNLGEIRDSLLPRLMSGKIRVPT